MEGAGIGAKVTASRGYKGGDGPLLVARTGKPTAKTKVRLKQMEQAVIFLGTDTSIESEGQDRADVTLPLAQTNFALAALKIRAEARLPTVIVISSGGPLSLEAIVDAAHASSGAVAIVQTFWLGSATDELAQTLFGDLCRWGKLPYSIFRAEDATREPFESMRIAPTSASGDRGRTYRYARAAPLFPFGWGLSYTTVVFSALHMRVGSGSSGGVGGGGWTNDAGARSSPILTALRSEAGLALTVSLYNAGARDGDEVVQLYATPLPLASDETERLYALPDRQLVDFSRIRLAAGESTDVVFTLSADALAAVTRADDGSPRLAPGRRFILLVCNGNVRFDGDDVRARGAYRWKRGYGDMDGARESEEASQLVITI